MPINLPFKWNHFLAAVIAVTVLLTWNGVPLMPVLAGCAAAVLFGWLRQPKARSAGK